MEKTQYKVSVNNTISTTFTVNKKSKQEITMSSILFNLALENFVKEMQGVKGSQLANNDNSLWILGFTGDLDIIGNSLRDMDNVSRALKNSVIKVGLTVNSSKTKTLKLIINDIDP